MSKCEHDFKLMRCTFAKCRAVKLVKYKIVREKILTIDDLCKEKKKGEL